MQRNPTLDFIRGAAVLGILLLNIVAFGLPKAAYLNPAWAGETASGDILTWALLDLFAQSKFLTLFALLFGAGLYSQLARGKRWLQTRLSLLVLLGFLHILALWEGDILLSYGLVGLICWRMIRDAQNTRQLANTGIMLYGIGVAILLLLGGLQRSGTGREWQPDAASLIDERLWRIGGGTAGAAHRLDMLGENLLALGVQYGWLLAGMMLTGAALMRSGWLAGRFSQRHYRRCGWVFVSLGMLINGAGILGQWRVNWDYRWCAFLLQVPRDISAPFQALGYAALAFGYWPLLSRCAMVPAVARVGRMALTNYLLQSVLCVGLFWYGGLFMSFSRWQLLAFIPAIWTVNLLFSTLWLRYFPQGPLEWGWRTLSLRWMQK